MTASDLEKNPGLFSDPGKTPVHLKTPMKREGQKKEAEGSKGNRVYGLTSS